MAQFNIITKLEELKAREKEEMSMYQNPYQIRNLFGRKFINMLKLKSNEEQFENVHFDKEEREAIVVSEELRRNYFNNQKYLLPISILSTVGFMAVTKRCMKIDTFMANIETLAAVFGGSYIALTAFNKMLYSNNNSRVLDKVYEKAKLHAECVSLMSDLKFDEDFNLE